VETPDRLALCEGPTGREVPPCSVLPGRWLWLRGGARQTEADQESDFWLASVGAGRGPEQRNSALTPADRVESGGCRSFCLSSLENFQQKVSKRMSELAKLVTDGDRPSQLVKGGVGF